MSNVLIVDNFIKKPIDRLRIVIKNNNKNVDIVKLIMDKNTTLEQLEDFYGATLEQIKKGYNCIDNNIIYHDIHIKEEVKQ